MKFEEEDSDEPELLDNNHFADEFNISRGIDFESIFLLFVLIVDVAAVVNYTMPLTTNNFNIFQKITFPDYNNQIYPFKNFKQYRKIKKKVEITISHIKYR